MRRRRSSCNQEPGSMGSVGLFRFLVLDGFVLIQRKWENQKNRDSRSYIDAFYRQVVIACQILFPANIFYTRNRFCCIAD